MRLQIGPLTLELAFGATGLTQVKLPGPVPRSLTPQTLEEARLQLSDYPLETGTATEFRKKVWECLRAIPVGEVRTYGAVAQKIGVPGGARAVGAACACNPFLLVVPCHRVVGTGGLGGYRAGLAWKRTLLALESIGVFSTLNTE